MPFTLIKGTFHLTGRNKKGTPTGFKPDGDSIQFKPANSRLLDVLEQAAHPYRLTAIGSTNLRFEGIDAPELHYDGWRQPSPPPEAARDEVTGRFGMNPVNYTASGITVVPPAKDGQAGFILSRQLDTHGRPVAFVFNGKAPARDGSSVFLGTTLMRRSLNHKLLLAGRAYPLFYDTLYVDIRTEFTKAANTARQRNRGVWRVDKSGGVTIQQPTDLVDRYTVFPKLFRRLANFFEAGETRLEDLPAWMVANQENDEVFIISSITKLNKTHFDNVLRINGNRITLTERPTDLMFVSRRGEKLKM